MNKQLTIASLLAAALLSAYGPAQAGTDEVERTWRFKVLLGNKEIGEHRFHVRDQGERQVVEIDADFDVKLLFINAYRYDHENTEHWESGCMHRIESETDDNGELTRILGTRTENGFSVQTQNTAPVTFDASCVRSFAYWNKDILSADRLLNSQTGEWVAVNIEALGPDPLPVDGELLTAEKYRIDMDQGPITLWYEQDSGTWLALEAETRGGRLLRYQPVQLPKPALNTFASETTAGGIRQMTP